MAHQTFTCQAYLDAEGKFPSRPPIAEELGFESIWAADHRITPLSVSVPFACIEIGYSHTVPVYAVRSWKRGGSARV